MLIYNGQIIAGGGTIVLPMTRAEYEANKAILDSADVWVDLTDEPDQVATADQIAYSVDNVQKSMGYIGSIATKAVAKVEPTDTALYLHEVGEYFINKDGDACKVDLQIPVNGTITLGTNCHVVDGVVNDINSNLAHVETYDTNYKIVRTGKMRNLIINGCDWQTIKSITLAAEDQTVGNIMLGFGLKSDNVGSNATLIRVLTNNNKIYCDQYASYNSGSISGLSNTDLVYCSVAYVVN